MFRDLHFPLQCSYTSEVSQPADSEVAHQVLRSIRQIVRRISAYSKHLSQHVGLTVPQLLSLRAIGVMEEEGEKEITVARVSASVNLTAATVSRIIDRLVAEGLVNRERTAKDRRKVCLSLTEAGLDRYQSLPTPLQEQFVERFSSLPLEERVQLLDALERLADLMDAKDIDAAPILYPGEVFKTDPERPYEEPYPE